ncbi:pseudouridine synthase [Candidatus Omnitrophota bacterium]
MSSNIRLQVALAQLGFAARRTAAVIIKAGRVKVNGQIIFAPGHRVNLDRDKLTVDEKSRSVPKKAYFILNKPKQVICTVKDRHAERSVLDLIKNKPARIYPVGRLDKDTTGLLLLTNDGDLAYRLTHPKFAVPKVYRVVIAGKIEAEQIKQLEAGILLEGKKTYPCKIRILAYRAQVTKLEICLNEGRKRQIKKMFAAVGHTVSNINRISFGPLKLGQLSLGCCRELTAQELRQLKKLG